MPLSEYIRIDRGHPETTLRLRLRDLSEALQQERDDDDDDDAARLRDTLENITRSLKLNTCSG